MPRETLHYSKALDGELWPYSGHAHRRGPHTHAELEFNLVLAGRATYLIEERRYQLDVGTLIWLYPDQPHVLLDESASYRMWIGVFRPRLLKRWCIEPAYAPLRRRRPTGAICHQLSPIALRDVDRLCSLVHAQHDDVTAFNAGLPLLLCATWRAMSRSEPLATVSDVHPAVERAARLLQQADDDNLSIADLGRRVGLSGPRLSRLFKQQTGVPLARFRQRQRMDRFVRFFGDGQRYTLLDAALRAGFGSYAQFHRVFVSMFHESPRDHLQHLRRREPDR